MRDFTLEDISVMQRVGMRDMTRRPADLVHQMEAEGPLLLTRNGKPVAVLAPIRDPKLRRRRLIQPVVPAPRVEEPEVELPEVELDDYQRPMLLEVAEARGRRWIPREYGGMDVRPLMRSMGKLECDGLVCLAPGGLRISKPGAVFVEKRLAGSDHSWPEQIGYEAGSAS